MAWASSLEHYPDHVYAIGMISIENSNLELSLSELFSAVLFLPKKVGHAIFFTPRANTLRVVPLGDLQNIIRDYRQLIQEADRLVKELRQRPPFMADLSISSAKDSESAREVTNDKPE